MFSVPMIRLGNKILFTDEFLVNNGTRKNVVGLFFSHHYLIHPGFETIDIVKFVCTRLSLLL